MPYTPPPHRSRQTHGADSAFFVAQGVDLPLWKKALAVTAGAGLFVLALMFSVLLFALVLTVGGAAWAWLRWKSRSIRKEMREQAPAGRVIEGVVIREVRDPVDLQESRDVSGAGKAEESSRPLG